MYSQQCQQCQHFLIQNLTAILPSHEANTHVTEMTGVQVVITGLKMTGVQCNFIPPCPEEGG